MASRMRSVIMSTVEYRITGSKRGPRAVGDCGVIARCGTWNLLSSNERKRPCVDRYVESTGESRRTHSPSCDQLVSLRIVMERQ